MIPKKIYSTGNVQLDRKIHELVEGAGVNSNIDLLEEMILTAFKLCEENLDRGDVKLMNTALKELRYAFKVFFPYRNIRKVAIFGSARTPKSSADYAQAREFAREIIKREWMVITGASSGIMNAGNEGAGRSNSFGVNIRLPFEQEANPVIANDPKLINFKYFFTRKLIFIRESDATLLCPGGFGTHDEGFETITLIQTGKTNPRPVVCLDPPGSDYWSEWRGWVERLASRKLIDPDDVNLIHFTHDPLEAARIVVDFYRNYHSSRYIGDLFVLRIKKALESDRLAKINSDFKGIVKYGKIKQQSEPFKEELQELGHTGGLTRLFFYFNRRQFSRLKRLIEAINETY
jgi:uncharacterized protein (TIGR00730 family)